MLTLNELYFFVMVGRRLRRSQYYTKELTPVSQLGIFCSLPCKISRYEGQQTLSNQNEEAVEKEREVSRE